MTKESYQDEALYKEQSENKLRNNWFQSVSGYCELILDDCSEAPGKKEWLRRIFEINREVDSGEVGKEARIILVERMEATAREILAYLDREGIISFFKEAPKREEAA
ncbi:MAG: hypothetical protein Q7S16_04220 [bacterium]|nr:hypothetical protein [bacterium]